MTEPHVRARQELRDRAVQLRRAAGLLTGPESFTQRPRLSEEAHGRFCVQGVIYKVYEPLTPKRMRAVIATRESLAEHLRIPPQDLSKWSAAPGRTWDEVRDALNDCAEAIETKSAPAVNASRHHQEAFALRA